MTKLCALTGLYEKSIFWQQHVLQASRDPIQKARCKRAIERLEKQLAAVKQSLGKAEDKHEAVS